MGAQEKSPNASTSMQRVKVYRLNENGKWDDQGTGHVTVDFLERSENLGLFVIDEEDSEMLLLHRISSIDIYRKQEDTIISWRDPELSTELALSFQESTGCSYIWDHICSIQRNMHFSSLEEHFGLEQNIVGTNSNKKKTKDESKTSLAISYEDLEPHFGKRLEDAANDLGVSRSTLKRARRDCGLNRWPFNMKNKKNPSLFLKKSSSKLARSYDQRIFESGSNILPVSNLPSQPNLPLIYNHSYGEVDKTHQENNVVTIKAKFKEDFIKFDLCLSSGLEKLKEEVAKRLDLMIANFKLKYKDDDDDLILLTCNEDLHHCVKSMRPLDKRIVQVLVHVVSK